MFYKRVKIISIKHRHVVFIIIPLDISRKTQNITLTGLKAGRFHSFQLIPQPRRVYLSKYGNK